MKTIELRNSSSITVHWVKGYVRLNGNERADSLSKTAASYNSTIAYDIIPINRGKQVLEDYYIEIWNALYLYTGLFVSPYGISELDCATTKTDTAERSISIGRESLQAFFIRGALVYFQVPPLEGSRDEKWRSQ